MAGWFADGHRLAAKSGEEKTKMKVCGRQTGRTSRDLAFLPPVLSCRTLVVVNMLLDFAWWTLISFASALCLVERRPSSDTVAEGAPRRRWLGPTGDFYHALSLSLVGGVVAQNLVCACTVGLQAAQVLECDTK